MLPREPRALDSWYWGFSVGITGFFPVGSDLHYLPGYAGAANGDRVFLPAAGIVLQPITFDFHPWLQVLVQIRFAWPGLSKDPIEAAYSEDLNRTLVMSSLMGVRAHPWMIRGLSAGSMLRPFIGLYYSLVLLEAKNVSRECPFSHSSEGCDDITSFKTSFTANALVLGLGLRYDIPFSDWKRSTGKRNLLTFAFEVLWSINFWRKATLEWPQNDSLNQTETFSGAGPSIHHILLQFTVGVML